MADLWPDTELGRLHKQVHQLTGRVQRLEKLLIALTEDYSINHTPDTQPCRNGGPGSPLRYCETHREWHMKRPYTSQDEYVEEDTATIIRGQD